MRSLIAFALLGAMVLAGSAHAQTQNGVVTVSAPVVLLPDIRRTPLATLSPGTSVQVIAKEGYWYKVSFRDQRYGDRFGYMRVEHVSLPTAATATAKANEQPAAATGAVSATPKPVDQHSDAKAARTASPKLEGQASLAPATVPAPPATTSTSFNPLSATSSVASPLSSEQAGSAGSMPAQSRPGPSMAVSGANSGGLGRPVVSEAIALGLRQKGRTQGLRLLDSGQSFLAAMGSGGTGATASNGFRVQVYTPIAWIRQLASDAAKEYRTFTVEDVGQEATEPVLRIIAFPDTPNTVTAQGMRGTSSVQHVVLRSEDGTMVVQPVFKEAFSEEASNAMGGRAVFEGLRLKFPMDAVRELRGPRGDREFFITVVGSTGEEKHFKVKKKHFDELPDVR